ncbi:ChuX/HutX family heme-like substrate-binding protein [Hymenobacter sp. ASUV-10]|uniref:ChuX/HutX family heme-like substrate-binding protein n=1 Tax=Hymenobacter aranciens TaxID=3063996 RepID=A0ABT9B8G4_9BACT|nr:ChuX/HutX family heme-like substrate-binding protein [Hymenobacter sp. ASUV-10]MDO7874566.1 ChuX/HutX family heme-like substrate-binding protein [Hymenobacter sp. ASUV-10]
MSEILTASAALATRWAEFKAANPQTRIRDAAKQLNSSEAELLATQCSNAADSPVVFLAGDFRELLKEVPTLGHVMALTRNDSVVHERKGPYRDVSFQGQMGLVLGEDIDLRLFMMHWQFGFAVSENGRRSLQFFAADGEALHKIYLTETSDDAAYDALVARYRADVQPDTLATTPSPTEKAEASDDSIDVAGFQAAWRDLQDTHAFFGLLRQFGLSRTQALRLGPPELLRRVANDAIERALRAAAAQEQEVMIFVASRGCIQIHTGAVHKIVPTGPWINVLDPEFNLHLKLGDVAESWVVQKPTADGVVTSLELFDAQGRNLLLLFGKRKPGIPEQESWRELVAAL